VRVPVHEREDHTDQGVNRRRLDFDTRKDNARDRSACGIHPVFNPSATEQGPLESGSKDGTFTIPPGSRKAVLVHLAREAWRAGLLDPNALGQVRGRDVDEAGLQRALYRSSIVEIEYLLGPILKGRRVIVEGRLPGTGRYALVRLGAEVEELRPENEERYIDMTPVIFVVAARAMAARFVSLGLDDQSMYILSGIAFALLYGLRPFISKLQRPKDR
jgi:hypothetical protein